MTAYEQRSYPGAAADTLLNADITSGATSFSVTPGSGTGYPDGSSGPFFVIIDWDNSKAEKLRCSGRVNDTFTVAGTGGGRGQDGTSAQAHTANAKVRAVLTATDIQEANRAAAQTIGRITSKGDLTPGSGANTTTRLPVGGNGALFYADSTQTGGVAWHSTLKARADGLLGDDAGGNYINAPSSSGFLSSAIGKAIGQVVRRAQRFSAGQTADIDQWQDESSVALLAVDKNGHLAGRGTGPTLVTEPAMGTTPPTPLLTRGSDQAGTVTFGTGTAPTTGFILRVVFNRPYGTIPMVALTPRGSPTAALGLYIVNANTTNVDIGVLNAPGASAANTTYGFDYLVIG